MIHEINLTKQIIQGEDTPSKTTFIEVDKKYLIEFENVKNMNLRIETTKIQDILTTKIVGLNYILTIDDLELTAYEEYSPPVDIPTLNSDQQALLDCYNNFKGE
jgi:hypothetical protein